MRIGWGTARRLIARVARWGLVGALAGCGRVAFDPLGDDGGQGGGQDGQVQDALACANAVIDDAFDDDTIDATLWTFGPASSETQGTLSIVPAALNAYYGLSSVSSYDFRNRSVGVVFSQVPSSGTSGAVGIRTKVPSEQDFTYAEVRDQVLRLGIDTPTTPNPLHQTAYDATVHRFIRMREVGSRLYWEASATGDTWTLLADAPSPALIRNAALWAYAYDVVAPLDAQGSIDRIVMCPN